MADGRTDGPAIRPTARPRGSFPDPSASPAHLKPLKQSGCPGLRGSRELVEAGPGSGPAPQRLGPALPAPEPRLRRKDAGSPARLRPRDRGLLRVVGVLPLPFPGRRPERKSSREGSRRRPTRQPRRVRARRARRPPQRRGQLAPLGTPGPSSPGGSGLADLTQRDTLHTITPWPLGLAPGPLPAPLQLTSLSLIPDAAVTHTDALR